MKRILLTTAICASLPLAAHAEDILIRADLSAATVFAAGADVTRVGAVAIPAGRHRLLIAMPDMDAAELPQITGPEGVRFGPPQPVYGHPIEEGALDNAAQSAARSALEVAEDAVAEAQDALTEATAAIRSIETQQAYIAAILRGGENGVAMPEDLTQVPLFLATLGAETERLAAEMLTAQIVRRDFAEALSDAQQDFADAARTFQALTPFGTQINVFAIDVTTADPIEADVALEYFTRNAAWRPSYELDLDTDTGTLAIDRFVTLQTYGAARWNDVEVVFSTSDPQRSRVPSELSSIPARLIDPAQDERAEALGRVAEGAAFADALPAPAANGIVQLGFGNVAMGGVVRSPVITAEFTGLSVSYLYPELVSVAASGDVLLAFDTLELAVETENRAVPRWDETAFLVAMVENDTGEPILPGGARFYRDGALMGEGSLPLIAMGAEAEMAFGALDHLQLTWTDRSLAEGDRGLFVSSNTQSRGIAFGVENTGAEAETVRILYATPFAEQEDLELDLTLSPRPSEEDIDDQRGIHGWDIEVASGEEEIIEMTVDFEFPDGQILDWQP
ncbi:MAG TPA: mucoidy inhibitor MuiA family protein [Roseibacterium sp.]|nr:mucoidy inhibitor MuiA family protein [Roseibacterium sp.]